MEHLIHQHLPLVMQGQTHDQGLLIRLVQRYGITMLILQSQFEVLLMSNAVSHTSMLKARPFGTRNQDIADGWDCR